jgi:hypothetical protein
MGRARPATEVATFALKAPVPLTDRVGGQKFDLPDYTGPIRKAEFAIEIWRAIQRVSAPHFG